MVSDPLTKAFVPYARLLARKPSTAALIKSLRSRNLTYVGRRKMRRIAMGLELVRATRVPGTILEAGVALGGTAILLAKLRPKGRPLLLYDTFGMIPPPGPQDEADAHERYETIRTGKSKGIGGEEYYGYQGDLVDQVRANLAGFGIDPGTGNVSLIKGTFEDTLHPDQPIAFAHIDCDWYASVVTCIERIFPKLSNGGIMIFDDYGSYSGCRKAVDEFLADDKNARILFAGRSVGVRKIRG